MEVRNIKQKISVAITADTLRFGGLVKLEVYLKKFHKNMHVYFVIRFSILLFC